MGDFEQNMQEKQNKTSFSISKSLSKQISSLCTLNKNSGMKQKNETTKKTKLFLSTNFQIIKNNEPKN